MSGSVIAFWQSNNHFPHSLPLFYDHFTGKPGLICFPLVGCLSLLILQKTFGDVICIFTSWMQFLSLNQQCQATEVNWKWRYPLSFTNCGNGHCSVYVSSQHRCASTFYRTMLCIHGTSNGPVSVSVRLSQVGVLLKRQNIGLHKQHHTIPQGL